MQLLQRWFQGFEQPVVSVTQQTAMLALLGTPNAIIATPSSAVQQQVGGCTSQDMDMSRAAAGAVLSQHELPEAANQRSAEACAAVSRLSVMQRMLIDRIVRCFVAITKQDLGGSSREDLMQWLAMALTKPDQLGTGSVPSMEQQALMRVLDHHASSSTTVQTPTETPFQPALESMLKTAVVTENMATAAGAQGQAAMCQVAACATAETPMLLAAGYGPKIAAHMADTTDAGVVQEAHASGKPGHEVEHNVEDGCMWFHKRFAKMGISRLH